MGTFTFFYQEAGFPMANDFLQCATSIGDYRSACRHRFNCRKTERFIPFDREKQSKRLAHDLPQGQPFQLSQVRYTLTVCLELWLNPLFIVATIIDTSRNQQSIARHCSNLDSLLNTFFRCDAPG